MVRNIFPVVFLRTEDSFLIPEPWFKCIKYSRWEPAWRSDCTHGCCRDNRGHQLLSIFPRPYHRGAQRLSSHLSPGDSSSHTKLASSAKSQAPLMLTKGQIRQNFPRKYENSCNQKAISLVSWVVLTLIIWWGQWKIFSLKISPYTSLSYSNIVVESWKVVLTDRY